ncbi:hypothetical protein D3C85_1323850 [compost metagenome]
MTEKGKIKVRLFSDAMNGNYNLPVIIGLQRQAGIHTGNGSTEVKTYRYKLISLVAS